MKTNYDLVFEEIVKNLQGRPKVLLHSCCGPCSTHVINVMKDYFDITVIYYNPNIQPIEEYEKRKKEQIKLLNQLDDVSYLDCDYHGEDYEKVVEGLELEKEGGKRCEKCIGLRMRKIALVAKENQFDYFATTLTVSPHKNSQLINELGRLIEEELGIKYLYGDFKKNDGYLKSIELAKKYNLYRQNYCGCLYAKTID
ncbi:MAG: epoxyqueuosine reductase QueH [Bacilli bacterium]|nr:epoxyqueuosine reductase QueH [Bacilli bacterium]